MELKSSGVGIASGTKERKKRDSGMKIKYLGTNNLKHLGTGTKINSAKQGLASRVNLKRFNTSTPSVKRIYIRFASDFKISKVLC